MTEIKSWFHDYVLLQFRMDKLIRKFSQSRFVDQVFKRFLTEQLCPSDLAHHP